MGRLMCYVGCYMGTLICYTICYMGKLMCYMKCSENTGMLQKVPYGR